MTTKDLTTADAENEELAMSGWVTEMGQYAQEQANQEEETGLGYIRYNSGTFMKGDEALGNEIDVVILGTSIDRAYYEGAYDENNIVPPQCSAVSLSEVTLVPNPDSPALQNADCKTCWANKFKSAKTGRGKACSDKRRIAIIPVDSEKGAAGISDEDEVAMMRIAPTSLKEYRKWHDKVVNAKVPTFAWVITLKTALIPGKTYSLLSFHVKDVVPVEKGATLASMYESVKSKLLKAYDTEIPEPQEKATGGAVRKSAKY